MPPPARVEAASLITWFATDQDPPVTLYKDGNYAGDSQQITVGSYTFDELAIGNDAVSSIKVRGGYRVTLYEHGDRTGQKLVLTADTPALGTFNDKTSYVLVERV